MKRSEKITDILRENSRQIFNKNKEEYLISQNEKIQKIRAELNKDCEIVKDFNIGQKLQYNCMSDADWIDLF